MNDLGQVQVRRAGAAAGSGLRFGAGAAAALALLAGCASLPVSGPTGKQVLREAATTPSAAGGFRIVELSDSAALPPALPLSPVEEPRLPPPPTDMIGAGDVLDIGIYEAGVALFAPGTARSGGADGGNPAAGSFDGAAQVSHLPPQRVDDAGYIRVPYAGRLRAAGHTPEELGTMIHNALRRMSQNPQVVVSIQLSIANSVIIGGAVGRPGRLTLTTNRESLSDAIALAGGYRGEAKDLTLRIARGPRNLEYRLSDALSGVERDMRVLPGDRIEVVRAPQTFAVMGAAGKVEQLPFSASSVSLAEAVAQAGGANAQFGDAKAIFVFRFAHDEDGRPEPLVYHLNMMHPGAFFLSQQFAMRDKDVLYIGNAGANQPSKLIQLVSQLFAPITTATGIVVNSGL